MKAELKKHGPRRPWPELSQKELAVATAEFDLPDDRPGLPGKPLTAAQRRQHERAHRRNPGRPRVGGGSKTIALTMERGLLKRVDAFAKQNGLKRAQLVAKSLEALMMAS
jgi:hypothetical protein